MSEHIKVRFAPSPTGYLHIGSVRTALFNFLYARKVGGTYVLRIEDTDIERNKKEYEDNIIENLKWLGLAWDEFYRQSERGDVYKKYLAKLIDEDKAYVSKEEPSHDKDGKPRRSEVIRLKNPGKKILFHDSIRGEVEMDTAELKDFVIAKNLDEPLYHLAVVVDDHEMGITHVIRGEDHISNTPRQILIQEAIGASRPEYAHLPLVLAPDKSKLSKRKHGEMVALSNYRDQGYLPDALNNFLALIGWNPGGEEEIFNLDELTRLFSLEKIQKGGAVFNIEKLRWVNKEHLKKMPEKDRFEMIKGRIQVIGNIPEEILTRFIPTVFERIEVIGDIDVMAKNGEFDYLLNDPQFPKEMLGWKGILNTSALQIHLAKVYELLVPLREKDFTAELVKNTIWPYAESEGRGEVLWPMRVALSGKEKSPDPFMLAYILGKETTLRRLENAQKLLQ